MTVEIMNKRFSISLTTIVGIVTTVTSVVGVYWNLKLNDEVTKNEIDQLRKSNDKLIQKIEELDQTVIDLVIYHNQQIREDVKPTQRSFRRILPMRSIEQKDTIRIPKKLIRKDIKNNLPIIRSKQ